MKDLFKTMVKNGFDIESTDSFYIQGIKKIKFDLISSCWKI